jgi:tricorn protease
MMLSPAMAGADDVVGARYPALSPDGSVVTFEYWGDLWVAPVDGSDTARRLTDHMAWDWYPRFSPDGEEIAFISNRSGNQDVWVIPAAGGSARQVTTYSGTDTPAGWSPDGERLIFESQRGQWSRDLYTVDRMGVEPPQQLTKGDHYNSIQGQVAQDGSLIYARGGGRWWRKGYLGTSQCDIWQLHDDGRYQQLTMHQGKDLWPMLSPDGAIVY